ncbi:putative myosin-1 isoform X2 [Iris pallida]|uniref:Myosin-1 isoform X2 n=1 Tax=Iris pallida TaxID=29817 RepID=A0AAX6DI37_IRIPA|nr:putative myosin-1 isoform X2 [Iris pallida]
MTAASAASAVRNSLEEMLESLRRRDQKPKDVPPALPARPPSRARLPSQRRSLPVGFHVELKGSEETEDERAPKGDEEVVSKTSMFGNKRITNVEKPEETPMLESENYISKPLSDDKFECNGTANLVSEKDTNMEHPQVQPPIYAEVEMQMSKVEATLRQKEEENNKLKEKLQEYEKKCSENEAKLKSMEEEWKTQVACLQSNLDAANKSQPSATLNASHVHYDDDSDVSSTDSYTPDSTPTRSSYIYVSNSPPAKGSDNPQDAVGYLVNEYEQQKQEFENHVRFLVEMKQGQTSMNSEEELRKLKAEFASWKKDYKVRLREAKADLKKLGVSNGDKARHKWWIAKAKKPGVSNGNRDKTRHKLWIAKAKKSGVSNGNGDKTRHKWSILKAMKRGASNGDKARNKWWIVKNTRGKK